MVFYLVLCAFESSFFLSWNKPFAAIATCLLRLLNVLALQFSYIFALNNRKTIETLFACCFFSSVSVSSVRFNYVLFFLMILRNQFSPNETSIRTLDVRIQLKFVLQLVFYLHHFAALVRNSSEYRAICWLNSNFISKANGTFRSVHLTMNATCVCSMLFVLMFNIYQTLLPVHNTYYKYTYIDIYIYNCSVTLFSLEFNYIPNFCDISLKLCGLSFWSYCWFFFICRPNDS